MNRHHDPRYGRVRHPQDLHYDPDGRLRGRGYCPEFGLNSQFSNDSSDPRYIRHLPPSQQYMVFDGVEGPAKLPTLTTYYQSLNLEPYLDRWALNECFGTWRLYVAQGAPLRIPCVIEATWARRKGQDGEEEIFIPHPSPAGKKDNEYFAAQIDPAIRRKLWHDVLCYGKPYEVQKEMRRQFLVQEEWEAQVHERQGMPPCYDEVAAAVENYVDLRREELDDEVRRFAQRGLHNDLDWHRTNDDELAWVRGGGALGEAHRSHGSEPTVQTRRAEPGLTEQFDALGLNGRSRDVSPAMVSEAPSSSSDHEDHSRGDSHHPDGDDDGSSNENHEDASVPWLHLANGSLFGDTSTSENETLAKIADEEDRTAVANQWIAMQQKRVYLYRPDELIRDELRKENLNLPRETMFPKIAALDRLVENPKTDPFVPLVIILIKVGNGGLFPQAIGEIETWI